MESYVLTISGRDYGSLLQNKTFVPLNGPILSITSGTLTNKTISFVRAAWNEAGSKIAACDCHGNVYIFNLQKNRFSLVCHLSSRCTFLTFSKDETQDILIALTDCTVVSLHSGTKSIRNQFPHHSSSVTWISFDKKGSTVLSCSKDQAILWDLISFDVLRVLALKRTVDIVKVFFLPDNDIIVSAFKDNTVFLWDLKNLTCVSQFICDSGNALLNIKTIDGSSDGKILACAGKTDWFIIWSIENNKKLYTVALPQNTFAKQISFLPSLPGSPDSYILSVLNLDGDILIYDLKSMEHLYKLKCSNGKIISHATSPKSFQLLTISLQGNLDLYDIEDFVLCKDKEKIREPKIPHDRISQMPSKLSRKKLRTKKREAVGIDKKKLKSIVKNFEEYPEKHRVFIWSQLLELPYNKDAFNVLHQESLGITSFNKDYSFMNPGVRKTFLRIWSMLICWYPVIQEIEYFQCVVFPFVKVLHKNTITCFEVLVTLISNWCQNWFLFCPFPPFNILCVVENLISFHDKKLMTYFIEQDISAEVYAWPLLKTSFSETFNKNQWLKLWDHIFSNPLSFLLYAVAAFNIVIRDVLLRCQTEKQFKKCYCKHGISASVLIKKAYELQETTPLDINPKQIIGSFASIPKGAYPSFIQMSQMKVDLETAAMKILIDDEIAYIRQREDALEIRSNYLMELQKLQILRRQLFLEGTQLKDADGVEALNKKMQKIQSLIQENLVDQISMLKEKIGEDIFIGDPLENKKNFFRFKDYKEKLEVKNQ